MKKRENCKSNIKDDNEDIISREMEIIKIIKMQTKAESRLPYRERRKLALKKLNKSESNKDLDISKSNIILFNLDKIREAKDNFFEQKISKINDEKMTVFEKRLKILDELNSSYEFGCEEIIE